VKSGAANTRLDLPLARAAVDRAGELRVNPDELSKLWDAGRILHLSSGKFLVGVDEQLNFLGAADIDALKLTGKFESGEKLFLGINQESGRDIGYFAWCADAIDVDAHENNVEFQTLRSIGDHLSDLEMGLAVHAQALSNWHHTHQRCSKCGSTTTAANGGSFRKCDAEGSELYPRTDPAIIVLVADRTDRILLGRQKVWPENRFSCFAGFVEPGESFEHCVAREVGEESGVSVSEIYYLGSQPWPFPASIMISFQAVTDNPEAARPDGDEIEEILWFSRESMKNAIAEKNLLLPPAMSVARKMIEAWFASDQNFQVSDLVGGESWRA
jgi:NAD+ diphosphatase